MSNHTKRKFVGNVKLDFIISNLIENNEKNNYQDLHHTKYTNGYLQLEDNTVIGGFIYLHNQKQIFIPEPEPSILYFTNAESKLVNILKLRDSIFQFKPAEHSIHDLSHIFFNFFQLSSDYIINLFTSIEAFNNSLIPDGFEFDYKKEKYGKTDTQRSVDFMTKVKRAVPEIMQKSFVKEFQDKYDFLLKLKELRDNTIHTKNMYKGFPSSYRELYKNYLDFDFGHSYNITKDYFNFYMPNWIENCNCEEK